MDEWELEKGRNDDYEYGYDYLYEEQENRPFDAAEDDERAEADEDRWWEDDEDAALAEVRTSYRDAEQEDESETADSPMLSYAEILTEIRAEEKEKRESAAQKLKKRLVRDMKAEAILRMESAARSEEEFRAVQAVWDDNDASRERWERLHEVLQGDTVIEAVTDMLAAAVFPRWMNDPTVHQLQRGNFLDYLADCPYEMHDLTAKKYIQKSVLEMKEEHKELLFFLYLRLLSPQHVAELRGQSDRNIRKVRDVTLRKLRKKVYQALKKQTDNGYTALTKQEREFMDGYERQAEL